jgi:hypothetical protein
MVTIAGPVVWSACWLTTVVCAVLAARRPRAVRAGRISVGVLMLVGGALFNAAMLAQGNDYADFADPSPLPWIARTWRAVVPQHHVLLIGLLVLFEAAVGLLVLSGGRRTQLGYIAALAFHLLLWLFGWFEVAYCVVMVPALVLLLRAERRAGTPVEPVPVPG